MLRFGSSGVFAGRMVSSFELNSCRLLVVSLIVLDVSFEGILSTVHLCVLESKRPSSPSSQQSNITNQALLSKRQRRGYSRPWRGDSINAEVHPLRQMDNETTSADDSGDEETENWEGPTPRQRAWSNCVAFLATILVIVGELSSEQNLIGLVVIGGALAVLNVLITASSLEKARELETDLEGNSSSVTDTALRTRNSSHRRAQDMTSIDLEDLSFENENDIHRNSTHFEEAEKYSLLPRHPSRAHSYYRRWYNREPEAVETRRTRYGKTNKRTRRETRFDDEEPPEEVPPRRSKDSDTAGRKPRKQKPRKDKRDRGERVERHRERHRERDKRDMKHRENKHKKKKRVTIASGSREQVVIGI